MKLNVRIGAYQCPFELWSPSMGHMFDMYAYDTETTEINAERPELTPQFVVGAACDEERGVFLTRDTVLSFFDVHAGAQFICHNAAFDLKVTQRVFGARCDLYAEVEDNKVWDTLILKRLFSLATEGHTARNEAGLEKCVQTHLGVDLQKHVQDTSGRQVRTNFGQYLYQPLSAIPRPYLEYAAGDVIATWHLFWRLNEQIREVLQNGRGVFGYVNDDWLHDVVSRFGPLTHHIQLRASILMDVLGANGIAVDGPRREEKTEALTAIMQDCEQRLRAQGILVGGSGSNKSLQSALDQFHKEHPDVELNRTPKRKGWSTKKEDLDELACEASYFQDYAHYKTAEKLVSTYLVKMNHTRLHARFGYLATSGRTYCGDNFFNLQNLPREDHLLEEDPDAVTVRGCFVPGEGKVFIDADYSQIELVVLGYVFKHQFGLGNNLSDLINGGQDVHRLVGAAVLNKELSLVTKVERNSVKCVSFGRPGGMGSLTLQKIAKNTYNQDLSLDEVEERIAAYHRLCPELDRFLTDEVDSGLVIASTLNLTPANYDAATGIFHSPFDDEYYRPQSWLGGMLLKVLRDEAPVTRKGQPYSPQQLQFFWAVAQQLPVELKPETSEKLRNCQADESLWKEVSDWAGRRPFFTVTGRLRANAGYCASRNGLFQGPAADGMIYGLWLLWRAGYKVVAAIHDENVIELPVDELVAQRREEVERLMVEGMHTVIPGMLVRVESVITRSLNKTELDPRYSPEEGTEVRVATPTLVVSHAES